MTLATLPPTDRAATVGTAAADVSTAPGWETNLGDFPALSVVPWQFLIKDAVLLGADL